jgi:hypothetical protein
VRAGRPWTAASGAALVAFAWVYPHFLDGPAIVYLVAAPLGVIPCPTLIAITGLALLGDGLGSRAWSLVLAGAGLFYGVIGVLWLGVTIDVVLVAGSLLLVAAQPFPRRSQGGVPSHP